MSTPPRSRGSLARPAAALLGAALAGCITPIPSVTDLTTRNAADARSLAALQDESLDAFRDYVRAVEAQRTQLVDQARSGVADAAHDALLSRLAASGDAALTRFDDLAFDFLEQRFPARLDEIYLAPLRAALQSEATALAAMAEDVRAFPDDRRLTRDHKEAEARLERQRELVAAGEASLRAAVGRSLVGERTAFKEHLESAFAPLRASLAAPSALAPTEPGSSSAAEQLAALDRFEIAIKRMYAVHYESLETIDRYMKGDRVSFLFRDGDVAPIPVPVVEPSAGPTLALDESTQEIARRRAAVEQAAEGLADEAQRRIAALERVLATELASRRDELAKTAGLSGSGLR